MKLQFKHQLIPRTPRQSSKRELDRHISMNNQQGIRLSLSTEYSNWPNPCWLLWPE